MRQVKETLRLALRPTFGVQCHAHHAMRDRIGEMRGLETVATAVTAAETGHLVLASLHTRSAAATVDRMVDVFDGHEKAVVRTQLSDALVGVVSQLVVRTQRFA